MDIHQEVLKKLYYDPSNPASYGGVKRLWREAQKEIPNLKLIDVKKWLRGQDTYTMFRPVRKKFERVHTLVDGIDEQHQGDLLDISWFSRFNDGVRFLLVIIDIMSRFAWVRPLRDKRGTTVASAMKSILDEGRVPKKLQTDQGKEFVNSDFKKLMDDYGIHFFTTTDDSIKCALAERFNRTLRERIYRYLYHGNTNRYIDMLPEIVHSYNNSYHRVLKMSPASVTEENITQILQNLKNKKPIDEPRSDFNVGDFVRISRKKGTFEKGATSGWTEEIFKISRKKKTPRKYVYRLVDLKDEPITSIFYPEELTLVDEPRVFRVEKIIRKGRDPVTKKRRLFVKFVGYPDKFNDWIDDVDPIQ